MSTIKDVNFLPEYLKAKHTNAKKKALGTLRISICVVLVIVLFGMSKIVHTYYQMQDKRISQKILQFTEIEQKINMLSDIQNNKSKKISTLNKIEEEQIRVTELIDKINDVVPFNVKVTSYNIHGNGINISFETNSPIDDINLMSSLESLDIFKKVDVSSLPITDVRHNISFNLEFK